MRKNIAPKSAQQPAQLSLLNETPPAPVKTSPASRRKPVVKTAEKAAPPPLVVPPPVIIPEIVLTEGAVWKMSGRHGVAYVKNAALAGELLSVEPRHLAKAAMAVYYDRKGKAFAWQVRFDTARWEEVRQRLA